MSTLFNSGSEVNAIHPIFARELGLPIRLIDIGAQKINSTMIDIFGIVVVDFSMTNKANQVKFFEETFPMANVCLKVVFGMLFLALSSADIDFFIQELCWKTYTTKKALSNTRRVELVDKKEFAATALDSEHKIYVVHVGLVSSNASPSPSLLDVYPFQRP